MYQHKFQFLGGTDTHSFLLCNTCSQCSFHLVEALIHAHFGHLHHLARRPPVLGNSQFSFVIIQSIERDDMELILREIWRHTHADRINRFSSLSARLWIYAICFMGSTE